MDLIKRQLHDVKLAFKPLSFDEMMRVMEAMDMSGNMAANMRAGVLAIKLSLKELKGLKDYSGKMIVLDFDGEELSDKTIDLLINSQLSQPLIQAAMALVSGATNIDTVEGIKKLGK